KLGYEAASGQFTLHYYAHRLPLDPATYAFVLERAVESPEASALEPGVRDEIATLSAALRRLPTRNVSTADARGERTRDKEVHKATLARLVREHAPLAQAIEAAVTALNGSVGSRASFDGLDRLVTTQAYRLAYWRVAGDEINYRRFFDINDLAALRM